MCAARVRICAFLFRPPLVRHGSFVRINICGKVTDTCYDILRSYVDFCVETHHVPYTPCTYTHSDDIMPRSFYSVPGLGLNYSGRKNCHHLFLRKGRIHHVI